MINMARSMWHVNVAFYLYRIGLFVGKKVIIRPTHLRLDTLTHTMMLDTLQ